jgi:hypothetical protein
MNIKNKKNILFLALIASVLITGGLVSYIVYSGANINESSQGYEKWSNMYEIVVEYARNLPVNSEKYNLFVETMENDSAGRVITNKDKVKAFMKIAEKKNIDIKDADCKKGRNLIAVEFEPEEKFGDLGAFPRLIIMVDQQREKVCYSFLQDPETYFEFRSSGDVLE